MFFKKKECDKFGVETNEDEKRFVPKRDTGRRVEFDGRHAQKKSVFAMLKKMANGYGEKR